MIFDAAASGNARYKLGVRRACVIRIQFKKWNKKIKIQVRVAHDTTVSPMLVQILKKCFVLWLYIVNVLLNWLLGISASVHTVFLPSTGSPLEKKRRTNVRELTSQNFCQGSLDAHVLTYIHTYIHTHPAKYWVPWRKMFKNPDFSGFLGTDFAKYMINTHMYPPPHMTHMHPPPHMACNDSTHDRVHWVSLPLTGFPTPRMLRLSSGCIRRINLHLRSTFTSTAVHTFCTHVIKCVQINVYVYILSLIHIWRCRRRG